MNQILYNKKDNNYKNWNNFYKILFVSSISLFFTFATFLFSNVYKEYQNERISKKLNSSYSISALYSENIETPTILQESNPFVIGIIRIDKININYSILSVSNNELLDISVCRFAGPMPNEIGNLCIAGHNYVDYKFFSRLNELKINDTITIYDLQGNYIEYKIYDKYETKPDDVSCTFQDTNNTRIVTLITCNNVNGKRLVIHAKEIPS